MREYIERTDELILAVNAGARVIENTKRYHGASYCVDVFSNEHREIPYLKAAKILRQFDEIPAADVVPVVRCESCRFFEAGVEYYGGGTKDICRLLQRQMQYDDFCSYGERRDDNELC